MGLSIEDISRFCKEKGFVYQNSELYGGLAGFWDFGPLGVELKNNIKRAWWKQFVQQREDVYGIDGSIITHKQIWESSGHVACFADLLITCKKCKQKYRADQFLEEKLKKPFEGIKAEQVNELLKEHKLMCNCGNAFEEAKNFNLMFETHIGPQEDKANIAYLRPETAQVIFTNFLLVFEHARAKLPFGIAQIGKAFRNEISPRDFLFRSREFEQMEIEFFTHPEKINECPFIDEVKDKHIHFLSAKHQEENKEHITTTIQHLIDHKIVTAWHAYWIAQCYQWYLDLGINKKNLRVREHLQEELAHYAGACLDIEYHFPFGWKEICGNADRKQFDLTQHSKGSGKDIKVFDEETKTKVTPYVATEPSFGVERAFLAVLFDAYHEEQRENEKKEKEIIATLKLHRSLVPIQVCVFPLVNKLQEKAREVFKELQQQFICFYDKSGSVGRRYARADERGVPLCITVDFDTLNDDAITIRDRDTSDQIRVQRTELISKISDFYRGKPFKELGEMVK